MSNVTRRDFLSISGIAAAGLGLAGCSGGGDTKTPDAAPDAGGKDFLECLNPNSLEVLTDCKLEASLASAEAPASFQFMRQGYFCVDNKDSAPGHLVFNRSVSLKDSFKF